MNIFKYLFFTLFLGCTSLEGQNTRGAKELVYSNSDMNLTCIENKKELLTRTWQLKSIEVPGVVLNNEQKKELEKSLSTTTLMFSKSKVLFRSPNTNGEGFEITEQIWSFDKDCERVNVTIVKDKSKQVYKIKVSDRLLVIDQGDGNIMTLIPKK